MAELIVRCDGCSKGNPGPSGSGYILQIRGGRILEEGWVYLGECTNNQAEYGALIAAARAIKKRYGKFDRVIFITDSQLVANQLNEEWGINDPMLIRAAQVFRDTMSGTVYKIVHVYRELNGKADVLADKAVKDQKSGYRTAKRRYRRRGQKGKT